jgi:hypothetical protein
MTFVKGQSGNPAGRKPGSRNKATEILDQVTERRIEQVVTAVMDKACIGNGAAIRAVFDRLYPKRRGAPVDFALPPVRSAADVPTAYAAICDGVTNNELTPDEAETLIRSVQIMGRSLVETEAAVEVLRIRAVVGALAERAGLDLAAIGEIARRAVEREAAARHAMRHGPAPCPNCGFEPAEPVASATDQQAAPLAPATDVQQPPASAADLQAQDRSPDGAQRHPGTPPPDFAASRLNPDYEAEPLASATDLQGAPLAPATNLQGGPLAPAADLQAPAPTHTPWMREFLGPEADVPWPLPREGDPARKDGLKRAAGSG